MTLFMLKFRISKCIETEDRLVFALGLVEWEGWELTAKGCRVVFFFFKSWKCSEVDCGDCCTTL